MNSPDLVVCSGSPDIPNRTYEDSPKLLKRSSLELSFENGITEESKMENYYDPQTDSNEDLDSLEASFELLSLAGPCEVMILITLLWNPSLSIFSPLI